MIVHMSIQLVADKTYGIVGLENPDKVLQQLSELGVNVKAEPMYASSPKVIGYCNTGDEIDFIKELRKPKQIGYVFSLIKNQNNKEMAKIGTIEVYKLSNGTNEFITHDLDGIVHELENMEAGEKFTVSFEEMNNDEFVNLPEFEGW